nr:MAG TPA: hypothetical protein [Bacteriophage sp.]DAJ77068.1 MAG TPA: hypothetical protein [Caudoviricetes sp.]DAT67626.1 MAG TPA: hypothetical protein [Caudoviricetes sp.]
MHLFLREAHAKRADFFIGRTFSGVTPQLYF